MDDELEQIRARRMAELQRRPPADDPEVKAQATEARQMMLLSLLDNDARERLARISIVKPPLSKSVEDMIIRMAQTGQLRGKVSEQQLVSLLSTISESSKREEIVFRRRRSTDDD